MLLSVDESTRRFSRRRDTKGVLAIFSRSHRRRGDDDENNVFFFFVAVSDETRAYGREKSDKKKKRVFTVFYAAFR